MAKWANIQEEAKNFKKRKVTAKSLKPLTSRRYVAGQALSGLLASNSSVNMEVLRREAYEWAGFMLGRLELVHWCVYAIYIVLSFYIVF